MAIGRPMPPLILDDTERETLERWVRRPKTAQGLALRARIIIEGIKAEHLLTDKAYDTNEIVAGASARGMNPVIPPQAQPGERCRTSPGRIRQPISRARSRPHSLTHSPAQPAASLPL